jgi:ABC-type phosphate transport system substrate-binding protein
MQEQAVLAQGRRHVARAPRALLAGAALAAAAAAGLMLSALPAGAAVTNPANNVIVGSGAQTSYGVMNQLNSLFNTAPGCQQFVGFPNATTPQELNFSCVVAPTTTANPENPYSDVAIQEPPLGSSNGILQLGDSGAHGATAVGSGVSINVAQNVNFATSARAAGSSDLEGLNFVAYGADALSWFHYTEVGKVNTPSSGVTSLTQAQLKGIWDGQYTNWNQVGGTNAPIVVFSAPEGAGVQSVWKTFIGTDPSLSTQQVNCYTPTGGSNTCVGPGIIGQNEDASMVPSTFAGGQSGYVLKNKIWAKSGVATQKQIRADAIYYFSYGVYTMSCGKKDLTCGGSVLPTGTTNALGQINGISASESSTLDGQFPVIHYLSNVYSNGFNPNIPAATAATLNYVSEVGFICNPNKAGTSNVVDPLTGVSYLSEIQSAIEAAGFYPLSAGMEAGTVNTTPIDEGAVPHTASALLTSGSGGAGTSAEGYSAYAPFDQVATSSTTGDPIGYCVTSDTDTNAGT